MLLMSFSQKGIDELRRHQEHMLMRHPDGDYVVSEGFDDGKPSYSIGRQGACMPSQLSAGTKLTFAYSTFLVP